MTAPGFPCWRCNVRPDVGCRHRPAEPRRAPGYERPALPPGPYPATPVDADRVRELVAEIEAFLDRTGMPQTVFGRRAMGDPSFVNRVRAGRGFKESTLARARRFIENASA